MQQTTPTPVETEVKIPVSDLGRVRDRLCSIGAELVHRSEREINILLDTPQRLLAPKGQVLRIRRFGARCILTYKGAARFSGRVKQREEVELAIDAREAEMMETILDRIGYQPWFRYEKDREVWRLRGAAHLAPDVDSIGETSVEICLDHTPMGDFVEIEGPIEALEPACVALRLDPERAVRGSYVTLWEEHRASNPTAPRHMVFEP